jgi:hypothetical protein
MKGLLMILGICLLSTAMVFAQAPTEFGPKVKNTKPWEKEGLFKKVVVVKDKTADYGPKVKNQRPLEKIEPSASLEAVERRDRKQLFGPAAKNRKPWENN